MPEVPHPQSQERRRDRQKVCRDVQRENIVRLPSGLDVMNNIREGAREQSHDRSTDDDAASLIDGGGGTASGEGRPSKATEPTGAVGPGAEPPVAVASLAFAHENFTHEKHDRRRFAERGGEGLSDQCSDDGGAEGPDPSKGKTCESRGRQDRDGEAPCKNSSASCSPRESTNNENEADTLPDTFRLSDEYGLEGASTGRRHHFDLCDDKLHSLRPRIEERRPMRGESSQRAARYEISSKDDDDCNEESTSTVSNCGVGDTWGEEDGDDGGSDGSRRSCFLSSPSPQRRRTPPPRFGRRRRPSRRKTLTIRRNIRTVPMEELPSHATAQNIERSRGYQRRGGSGKDQGSRRQRSPPRQRYRISREDKGGRGREQDNIKHRRRGGVLIRARAGSILASPNDTFEDEIERLRRENQALKQLRSDSRRIYNGADAPEIDSWDTDKGDDQSSGESLLALSRRQIVHEKEQDWSPYENTTAKRRQTRCQPEEQDNMSRSYNGPSENFDGTSEVSVALLCETRRPQKLSSRNASWSEFVSKSHQSPYSIKAAAWTTESKGEGGAVELSLPQILVEGGFLWKIPYHNAGTPKRRWFQMKPDGGLLTTADGRLVVRPTGAAGRSGAARHPLNESYAAFRADRDRGEEKRGRGEHPSPASMVHIRAAWPLTCLWMDPNRDLNRSPPRELNVDEIVKVVRGHKTPAFWQQAAHRGIQTLPSPELCFSVVGRERTLDLAAESIAEAREWVCALAGIVLRFRRGHYAAAMSRDSPEVSSCLGYRSYSSDAMPCSKTEPFEGLPTGDIRKKRIEREASNGWMTSPGLASEQERPPSSSFLTKQKLPGALETNKNSTTEAQGAWPAATLRAWRKRLFPAVARGDIDAVLSIFDQGCPIDLVQIGTGDTPLLLACRLGDIEIVGQCLRRGSRNDPHPDFGQTALQAAVAAGEETCARLLLETAAPSRSDTVVSNHKDPNQETPLHVACRRGFGGIVEALLHHGADLRLVDKNGNTPLHAAAGGGHAGALASLLDAGGDCVLEERNARGDRALHAATARGHVSCVELLLGTAAEPNMPNVDGQTPYALASKGGHLEITRLVKQYAPSAGTPTGCDAAHIKRGGEPGRKSPGGLIAASHVLPRPHTSGTSSTCRDLENRCYSAASLGRRYFERPRDSDSSEGRITQSSLRTAVANSGHSPAYADENGRSTEVLSSTVPHHQSTWDSRTASHLSASGGELAGCTSVPVHDSLFDGLQVYVVGGRQPLGSQHAAPVMTGGTRELSMPASAVMHQPSDQQQCYRAHQQLLPSSSSGGAVDATTSSASSRGAKTTPPDWNSILSAPSTVAPSPPSAICREEDSQNHGDGFTDGVTATTPHVLSGSISSIVDNHSTSPATLTVPQSARALARMLHFSTCAAASPGGKAHDKPGPESGSNGVLSGSPPRTGAGTFGVAEPDAMAQTTNLTEGGDGDGDRDEGVTSVGVGSWMTSPDQRKDDGSFVLIPAENGEKNIHGTTGDRSGRWRIFHSQGYPYYLHEGSGHSQWEDPRGRYQHAGTTSTPGVPVVSRSACATETVVAEDSAEQSLTSGEKDSRLSAVVDSDDNERATNAVVSPIKPLGVPVAVEVSQFVGPTSILMAGGVSASLLRSSDSDGAASRASCSEALCSKGIDVTHEKFTGRDSPLNRDEDTSAAMDSRTEKCDAVIPSSNRSSSTDGDGGAACSPDCDGYVGDYDMGTGDGGHRRRFSGGRSSCPSSGNDNLRIRACSSSTKSDEVDHGIDVNIDADGDGDGLAQSTTDRPPNAITTSGIRTSSKGAAKPVDEDRTCGDDREEGKGDDRLREQRIGRNTDCASWIDSEREGDFQDIQAVHGNAFDDSDDGQRDDYVEGGGSKRSIERAGARS